MSYLESLEPRLSKYATPLEKELWDAWQKLQIRGTFARWQWVWVQCEHRPGWTISLTIAVYNMVKVEGNHKGPIMFNRTFSDHMPVDDIIKHTIRALVDHEMQECFILDEEFLFGNPHPEIDDYST